MCDAGNILDPLGITDKYPAADPLHLITEDPVLTQAKDEAQRIRDEEAAREAQIAADKIKINNIFGVGPESRRIEAGPFSMDIPTAAGRNKAARQETLDSIYGDIMGEYTDELDTQYGRKEADVRSMLADRGLSRSSSGQSIFDRLGEIYDKQEASFEQGAGSAVTGIQDADNQTRTQLIDLISAGGDYSNAAESAATAREASVNTGMDKARARDLTALFKEMDELYGQKQYVDGYNTGQTYGASNLVTPGSSSTNASGTQINY